MGCSDTWAEVLEARDPDFRRRNEWNAAAREASRFNMTELCRMGVEAYEGRLHEVIHLRRMHAPSNNAYIEQDRQLVSELGSWREMQEDEYINLMADAADDLRAWKDGKGGKAAFKWLADHWAKDLDRLERTNQRHLSESESLRIKGRENTEKYRKRQERLALEIPEAEEVKKRLAWARSMQEKCES